MKRLLTILEVSQKQAYIFGSNKVADNIVNSAIIAKCLSPKFIKETLSDKYDENRNMVYTGGGHTILEFDDEEAAKNCVRALTETIFRKFDGLEVFARTIEYDGSMTPKENLKALTAKLEAKKSIRRSTFRHGTYGIEKLDVNTLKPEVDGHNEDKALVKQEEYTEISEMFTPEAYVPALKFEDLGGKKNSSNFIAVVHIDGNGMGKRVDELYDLIGDGGDWDSVKNALREFSDGIDRDFKDAYRDMAKEIADSLENGKLKGKLDIQKDGKLFFPVRRIITAGDDICFVTEGRIGLECAKIFISKLSGRRNAVDKRGYAACAGVAIVHQKYPFYRAYELAEKLCSSAKKAGAKISESDDGRNVCAIDWHIEFGEIKDSIEEINRDYIADDGHILTNRPYIVTADEKVLESIPQNKRYESFAENIEGIIKCEKEFGNGKVKQLRGVMKKGEVETENYLTFYNLNGKIRTEDYIFDAIELMDTFLFV